MNLNVYIFSGDYDGCTHWFEVRMRIYKMMLSILDKDPTAEFKILIASARQSNYRNLWTMNYNRNGNCFRVMHQFANLKPQAEESNHPEAKTLREKLEAHQAQIKIDGFLMQDIEEGVPPGTHFLQSILQFPETDVDQGTLEKTTLNTTQIPWFDENKIVLTSNQIRHVLRAYSYASSMTYYFFDDLSGISENVYQHQLAKLSTLPSKLRIQVVNASKDYFRPYPLIECTGPNDIPPPCTKAQSYELFFEAITGQTELSNIIIALINIEKRRPYFQVREPDPSSLYLYLSRLVNEQDKWAHVARMLKAPEAWARCFPDYLMDIAIRHHEHDPHNGLALEPLIILLEHGARYYINHHIQPAVLDVLTTVFKSAIKENNDKVMATLYPYLPDPTKFLADAQYSISILTRMIPTLSSLEKMKEGSSLRKRKTLTERLNRFTPLLMSLMLTDKPCIAFIDTYFNIAPTIHPHVTDLAKWIYSNVPPSSENDPALMLAKLTDMEALLYTSTTKTLFSGFLKTITAAPHAFLTEDAKHTWAILLSMNPIAVDRFDPLRQDESVFFQLSIALKAFAKVIPPIDLKRTPADYARYYLSFRLFTKHQLKTEPVDPDDLNAFIKKIRNAPLAVSLFDIPSPIQTTFGERIHKFWTKKLHKKSTDPVMKASIYALNLMLEQEAPKTLEETERLIIRWSCKKVGTSNQTHRNLWEEWSINQQSCCLAFFNRSRPESIDTALTASLREPFPHIDDRNRTTETSLLSVRVT
jgi:hypothetical protein